MTKSGKSTEENEAPKASRSKLDTSSNTLKIIPLGGLGEIGKNTMAIMCGNDIMLVDAGLAFPSEEQLGVDLVLPDITFLRENQDKIRGLAITHGHEDHIGGIPFILRDVTIPVIYGPALALGLLEGKLKENGLEESTVLRKVKPRQQVKIGCFQVEFIRCTHSIADAFSLIIRTPIGTLVHTGDFKFDFTPVDGEQFDIASLSRAGDEGVLCLLSDSTNTERDGYSPSERTVWAKINEVFSTAPHRIIVTTFASNVHRIRQVLQAAIKYERKVAILGRSMLNLAGIARELGYMTFPDGLLVPVDQLKQLPLDQVVILTTGSQGEPLSALSRIANNEHKQIKIIPGDTVVISATPIPGNERSVANTINALFLRGANVVYGRTAGVHVSGHACREEQKLMINLCKPKFFVPIHGEFRMLVRHAELAVECNVEPENTFVMENGEVLELSKDKAHVSGRVDSGVILIDSSRAFEIDESIVEQRRHIAEDGLVMVAMSVDQSSKLVAGPDVSLRGLILPKGVPAEEFVVKVQEEAKRLLTELSADIRIPKEALKHQLAMGLSDYFEENVKASPFVQIILNEISESKSRTRQSTTSRAEGTT